MNNSTIEHLLSKQMPSAPQAELALLGTLINYGDRLYGYEKVLDLISENSFYSSINKILYRTIINRLNKSQAVDMVCLLDDLGLEKSKPESGWASYLVGIQEDIHTPRMLEEYARLIHENEVRRTLIESSSHIASLAYSKREEGIEKIIDNVQKLMMDIVTSRKVKDFIPVDEALRETLKKLNASLVNQDRCGISSGFKQLDEMTNGFQKTDLIILAARPAMGKTSLAMNMALNAAVSGKSVGFFSIEMSCDQIALRLLSFASGIPHFNIKKADISSDEWIHIANTSAQIAQHKIYINDLSAPTISDIKLAARKLKSENSLDILFIDYLQLINTVYRGVNRYEEVSEVSRFLKQLARELEIPIVALSQLSRALETRTEKRPQLSDLRESGAIEQDADIVMFLYRDVVYNRESENPNHAELIISKHRNGALGTCDLSFDGTLTLFSDYHKI